MITKGLISINLLKWSTTTIKNLNYTEIVRKCPKKSTPNYPNVEGEIITC